MTRIAVLDDYQNVALTMADWSPVQSQAEVTVFNDYLDPDTELVSALTDFEVVCIMRERSRFPAEVLEQLPNLKLLITSGANNAAIDLEAATRLGITVCGTQSPGHAASELTWALILGLSRHIVAEDNSVRDGRWQTTVGRDLHGQTIGIVGLGRHGANIARYAQAFNMRVLAWSQNLTQERCDEVGVELADRDTMLRESDIITVHLKMGQRYRGLVDDSFFEQMKETAYIINTSRGPIIQEDALLKALNEGKIAGAGLDVYEQEPLPLDHPLRSMPNTLLTSHVGYVTEQTYEVFYGQTVDAILAWLAGEPIRQLS